MTNYILIKARTLPQTKILDSSKEKTLQTKITNLTKMAAFSKWVKNEKEKLLVMSNFSFSHSIFKRVVMQKYKKPELVWKRLKFVFHRVENEGKGENAVCHIFPFSHNIFERLFRGGVKSCHSLLKG